MLPLLNWNNVMTTYVQLEYMITYVNLPYLVMELQHHTNNENVKINLVHCLDIVFTK
jgi:hypothetical protein